MSAENQGGPLGRLLSWYLTLSTGISVLALCVLMVVTAADIIGRRLLGLPIHGHYELTQICLVLAVYGGLAQATRVNMHIKVDLIDHWCPKASRSFFQPLALIAVAVSLSILLGVSIVEAWAAAKFGDITADLRISLLWFWIPIIVSLSGAVISALVCAVWPVEDAHGTETGIE